ncbi:MAG: HAMP domain-containing protein [Candidatus Omnitrophica bacterium]|nr:HAMP domain-containing protein [Candidatus Omnitrophota bacterium]
MSRRRLVRHYFFVSVLLIGSGLIASGAVEIYFRYHETQEHLALSQKEAAAVAALRIERFIQEVATAIRGATKSPEMAAQGLSPHYRLELQRLLYLSPAIDEAVVLDTHGKAQAALSRSRAISRDPGIDLSASAAFHEAKKGTPYFGPVHFIRGSEPYMTIAFPIESFSGNVIGVLQAEVNLKYIWEVISGIKVGKAGYAYATTSSGNLIAHPDLSLVLQGRNIAHLEQVKAAFQPTPDLPKAGALVANNLQGQSVISSYAIIPNLGWAVFIERPAQEAYEPLFASVLRTSSLLLIGLGVALLASLFVARRVVRPLQSLREGVERIGSGDLSLRLQLKTGDEIEVLAEEFNKMTAALEEAYKGLERKVAERTQELVMANKRLDEASRYKSQFFANVTHELRTPLHAIIGFTRLVLRDTEGQLPELHQGDLQKVLASAEQLLNLINGVLDLSKIEAGRMEILIEPLRLEEVIHAAMSTIEPMLNDGRVRLTSKIAPDIQPMRTDREKLKQIVINLLSNAAKFTEEGEIAISAWKDNGSVKLVVSDTGIGMRKEALDYIFEEFRQAEPSGTRKYGGSGLGLAIVKRLVGLLGGEIRVESEPGEGSKFTVTLPINLSG